MGHLKAIIAGLVFAATASAEPIAASFVVENPESNGVQMIYQVRWGGRWKQYTIQPGEVRYHSHDLRADVGVPRPEMRFDNVGGDGRVTYATFWVKPRHVGDDLFRGTLYRMLFAADGRTVNLFLVR